MDDNFNLINVQSAPQSDGSLPVKPENYKIWEEYQGKKLLLVALALALVTHGVIFYFTLPKTYDAFVHIFFADHYSRFWFEPWEYRWYTGFVTISYPPMVHQMVALISKVFPLKVAFCIYAILIIEILILGIYRFTKLFYDKKTAGIAAILTVLLSSIVETLHVFGQMPTLTGIAFLLNALPFIYQYLLKRRVVYLLMSLSFLSVVVCSHHVTAIFGMVFFIAPTIFMSLADGVQTQNKTSGLFLFFKDIIFDAFRKYKQIILLVGITIILAIVLIFPYWYWSKTDPITQVSIPHGSRDNFFRYTSSGLVFYVIPLLPIFAFLPSILFQLFSNRRFIGWTASFLLCLLLGSGGTTPLPKMLLGSNAFNILTLDRFGFWASVIAIPFMAHFIHSLFDGEVKAFWHRHFSPKIHFLLAAILGLTYLLFLIFIFHLGSFRPLQPKEIDIQPMLNFLNRDDHLRWRYLTLGFGDQMAWLSANTMAATVDGNYHSARRLPELTSRPVERLENAKFNGEKGMESLSDFLSNSEKYSLKYVFNNDRFYDPLLYYSGWNRTIRLENGIMVWEKGNISTIQPIKPKEISPVLKKAWGIIPLSSVILALMLTFFYIHRFKERTYSSDENQSIAYYPRGVIYASSLLPVLFFSGFMLKQIYELLFVNEQKDPETAVVNFYNQLDFQRFENAFHFFNPSPTYTLDQFLLEKSVSDGGLLPSFAKLDSIYVSQISCTANTAAVGAFSKWRTSLGKFEKTDTFQLVKNGLKWSIIPPNFNPEIPDEQVRSYTYTIFKKQGKRLISSFPTVKDDKIKKPFAAFHQANFIRNGESNLICGEILNADDIPVNFALKAMLYFKNDTFKEYFPSTAFQYNLSPKSSSYFQIDLDSSHVLDSLQIESVELYAETDVCERGYIHGGTVSYQVNELSDQVYNIKTEMYNELTAEISIPALLIAEKDENGMIWQCKNVWHTKALRSGLHISFENRFRKIQGTAKLMDLVPMTLYINGQSRTLVTSTVKNDFSVSKGISILPHCFISQEIFLQ